MPNSSESVFICPKCSAIGFAEDTVCICPKCGANMAPTPYSSHRWWKEMTVEDRQAAVKQWMEMTDEVRQSSVKEWTEMSDSDREERIKQLHGEQKQNKPAEETSKTRVVVSDSPWIGLLRGAAYFDLIVGIIASLVYGILLISHHQSLLGIVVLVLGCLICTISVAGIMVFLDMAADVSAIRQLFEKQK